jgi:hypothetical protein
MFLDLNSMLALLKLNYKKVLRLQIQEQEPILLKQYSFVITYSIISYRFLNLLCLSKPMKGTDNIKDTSLLLTCQFSVGYDSFMSYSTDPGANVIKLFVCHLRFFVISLSVCPWKAFLVCTNKHSSVI